jgi:ubiquinone/menaquinone biosynthesis C-methylase UbiE
LKAKYGTLDGLSEANKVTVCDINENMLNVGKDRAAKQGFGAYTDWKVGNAERLVDEPDNTYDVYTIAFGIRNCTNIENVVREAYRVLKPGGRFMCMEFSRTNNPVFKQ